MDNNTVSTLNLPHLNFTIFIKENVTVPRRFTRKHPETKIQDIYNLLPNGTAKKPMITTCILHACVYRKREGERGVARQVTKC